MKLHVIADGPVRRIFMSENVLKILNKLPGRSRAILSSKFKHYVDGHELPDEHLLKYEIRLSDGQGGK